MKVFSSIIVCCLSMLLGYTQNYNDSKTNLEQEKNMYLNFMNTDLKASSNLSNIVYVSQQGANNLSEIKTKALKSSVKVIQKGDDNTALIDVKAMVIKEKIIQIGNGNFFKDYNHLNKPFHNVSVLQHGNNQKILVNGVNSISKELIIKQFGNDKIIYVNNF